MTCPEPLLDYIEQSPNSPFLHQGICLGFPARVTTNFPCQCIYDSLNSRYIFEGTWRRCDEFNHRVAELCFIYSMPLPCLRSGRLLLFTARRIFVGKGLARIINPCADIANCRPLAKNKA